MIIQVRNSIGAEILMCQGPNAEEVADDATRELKEILEDPGDTLYMVEVKK